MADGVGEGNAVCPLIVEKTARVIATISVILDPIILFMLIPRRITRR